MSVHEHKKHGPKAINVAVITVSDTRTEATDKSGGLIQDLLETEGHTMVHYTIVKDDEVAIKAAVRTSLKSSADAVIINGGTGIAPRDVTFEVIQGMLSKELPGFGELFRHLSYRDDIGSAAMLSRAIAGTIDDRAVFSIPGSSGAVRLAMEKLILPEIGHMVGLLQK